MAKKSKRKGISKQGVTYEKTIKYMRTALFIAVLIIVFYPPYLKGLYFESQQLPTEIFVFLVFAAFWVYKALKKDRRFLVTPIDYASFGFVIVYFLSIFVAVGLRLAIAEWLKYCMYFAVFFMISELAEDFKSKMTVLWVILVSGTGVALLGLDGAAGGHVSAVLNQFFRLLGVKHDVFFHLFEGGRIYSILQYPNTLAAYLMGIYFITLGIMVVSERIWAKAIAGAVSFILLLTFIFTLSRGAYLVMAVSGVIYLIVLPKGNRVKGAAFAFPPIISAGIISIKYAGYTANSAGNEMEMWLLVIAGTLVSVLLTLAVNYITKWLEKISWKVYAGVIGAVLISAVVASVYIYNASAPLELEHASGEKDSYKNVIKSVALKPGKEYKLVYEVNAEMKSDKPYSYMLKIYNRSIKDILSDSVRQLASFTEKQTNDIKKRELIFKVPEQSRRIDINFINYYEGTRVKFSNARILEADSGKVAKDIILMRRYIPYSISSRLESLSASKGSIERAIFYKDGLEIVKDFWLFGAGGGAWSLLYFSYQSYMYWTTQAHNFPLQLGVETGILGILIFVLLLVSIIGLFILNSKKKQNSEENIRQRILQSVLLTSIIAMFTHSVLDFDLSLSAVFLLMWEFIALFNSYYRQELSDIGYKVSGFKLFDKLKKLNMNPVLGVVLTVAVSVLPVMFIVAQVYADKGSALYKEKKVEETVKYYEKALSTDPFKPEYMVDYANLVLRNENKTQKDISKAEKAIHRAEAMCKYNVNLLPKIAQYYLRTGRIDEGLRLLDRTTELRPFRPEEWQQRISAYYSTAMSYFKNRDNENGLKYIDKTLALIDEAKKVNENNLVPFIFNAETCKMLEKLKFIKDLHSKKKEIRVDKMVFYNVPDLDIDNDGILDQWDERYVESYGFIQSRKLSLKTGKEYRIEMILDKAVNEKDITFVVTNISGEKGTLKTEQNIFTGSFTIPEELEVKDHYLRLYNIPNSSKIKALLVIEK